MRVLDIGRKNSVAPNRALVALFCLAIAAGLFLAGKEDGILNAAARVRSRSRDVVYHSCGYREYPSPSNASGLPYLADVFLAPERDAIVFVGVYRGTCEEAHVEGDDFGFDEGRREGTRFMCVFPDGVHALSDYVHPTGEFPAAFTFRCSLPESYGDADVGRDETELTVSLYSVDEDAIGDEVDRMAAPLSSFVHASVVLERNDTRMHAKRINSTIPAMPVCSNLWPDDDDVTPKELAIDAGQDGSAEKKHDLIVFTMVKMVAQDMARWHSVSEEKETRNETSHIVEWIEYHRRLGADRFVVYDNDDARDVGRLRRLLLPYIERGIVTHAWFPLPYCERQHGGDWKGWASARGQFAAEMSALHRYGSYARFYADFDVDEFLVRFPSGIGKARGEERGGWLLPFLRRKLIDEGHDVVAFQPHLMAPCDGARIDPSMLRIESWRCFAGRSERKLVMRPDRMRYYMVHYPILTVDWTAPRAYQVNETTEGVVAHYRMKEDYGIFGKESFNGTARNEFHDTREYMDPLVSKIKDRVREANVHFYGWNGSSSVPPIGR